MSNESRYPRKVEWLTPDPARPGCSKNNSVTIPDRYGIPSQYFQAFIVGGRYWEKTTRTAQRLPTGYAGRDDGCWKFSLLGKNGEVIGNGSFAPDEDGVSFAFMAVMFLRKGLRLRIDEWHPLSPEEKAALDAAVGGES
jgi:hypothetical protein